MISPNDINNSANTFSKPRLDQSIPNPSGNITTLRYFLPDNVKNASIQITSINGSVLKSYRISNNGPGQVTLNAKELAAGEYIYTLLINGSKVESKKMIISR